tara:strand:- start:5 stop:172 length:168 start_codon:yes stop_codon:yes gene_type:complete
MSKVLRMIDFEISWDHHNFIIEQEMKQQEDQDEWEDEDELEFEDDREFVADDIPF